MSNYFALFSLKSDFSIDLADLESAYQLQISQFHPDKFATKSEPEKSLALQNTSLLNTAYNTLKSPLKRATYLLELQGINAFDEKDTQMDEDFLMAQIEYRETLERAKNFDEIEHFIDIITPLEDEHIVSIEREFKQNNLQTIKNLVRQLRFYQQLKQQANELLDEL